MKPIVLHIEGIVVVEDGFTRLHMAGRIFESRHGIDRCLEYALEHFAKAKFVHQEMPPLVARLGGPTDEKKVVH